ncbi:HAMP domain-containing protein [Sulfurimonas aquatica]|uniref:histidine kinase n=1 Tax=Sulfurimonas aquatica TaxID=2672570 RepID=A0A975AY59_9BACT|nr:HAMP domain-containing sensor histidine kinase [Sulfurimonas aquatica]QSZ40635.1 HAMP domain-containing protein [Sulfurimonas aquatica]
MQTTLLKKLLLFILPLSILPLILMMLFYYMYLHQVLQNEEIKSQKENMTHIATDIKNFLNEPLEFKEHFRHEYINLSKVSIVDKRAKVLVRNFELKESDKIYFSKRLEPLFEKMLKTNEEKIEHDEANKVLIKPIFIDGKITYFIVSNYKHNLDEKFMPINQTFIYISFIIIFTVFIIAIFIIIFSLKILEPLELLMEGIEKISKGDLSHTIKSSSNDEFGVLVNAFNDMRVKSEQMSKDMHKQEVLLVQQSRLAQMGELISMIAHQWRQPLSSITAIVSTLRMDILMGEYKKDFFEERLNSVEVLAQHLSGTIDDFRTFFKADKEVKQTTIQEIVEGSFNIIAPALVANGILIDKPSDDAPIVVNTLENEMKQVLLNILKNAEDALLEKEDANPQIWISYFKEKEFALIMVEDNAGGIPESVIANIFDPYFSTKKAKDGTGLGLYMSKTIVEEHCHGELSVSNSDKGAQFIIKLPIESKS